MSKKKGFCVGDLLGDRCGSKSLWNQLHVLGDHHAELPCFGARRTKQERNIMILPCENFGETRSRVFKTQVAMESQMFRESVQILRVAPMSQNTTSIRCVVTGQLLPVEPMTTIPCYPKMVIQARSISNVYFSCQLLQNAATTATDTKARSKFMTCHRALLTASIYLWCRDGSVNVHQKFLLHHR
jgi:hypothetical protein